MSPQTLFIEAFFNFKELDLIPKAAQKLLGWCQCVTFKTIIGGKE